MVATSTKEREEPSGVSQREARARLGLLGLWPGVQLRGKKLPKVLGPLTEAQSKVVPGCTSQVPISCDSP